MEKINALSFIGKSHFDLNIISNGEVIYKCGDQITQDIIMKLYFKELYAEVPVQKPAPEPVKPPLAAPKAEPEDHSKIIKLTGGTEKANLDDFADNILKTKQKPDGLKFNKEGAGVFAAICHNFAQTLNYTPNQLEELKSSAYYHNVGCIEFTPADEKEPDFTRKIAEVGAEILETMGMSFQVIEGVGNFHKKYTSDTALKAKAAMPFSQVIAVVYRYNLLMKKYNDKDKSLEILRKNGIKYLNVFILHKFINFMRNYDG